MIRNFDDDDGPGSYRDKEDFLKNCLKITTTLWRSIPEEEELSIRLFTGG